MTPIIDLFGSDLSSYSRRSGKAASLRGTPTVLLGAATAERGRYRAVNCHNYKAHRDLCDAGFGRRHTDRAPRAASPRSLPSVRTSVAVPAAPRARRGGASTQGRSTQGWSTRGTWGRRREAGGRYGHARRAAAGAGALRAQRQTRGRRGGGGGRPVQRRRRDRRRDGAGRGARGRRDR